MGSERIQTLRNNTHAAANSRRSFDKEDGVEVLSEGRADQRDALVVILLRGCSLHCDRRSRDHDVGAMVADDGGAA
ncbi:hypothetical protein U1Q18_031647 [Sarracenia purpurea var. burkii]